MDDLPRTFRAPWGTSVKVLTILASVFLLGMAAFEGSVLPHHLLGGWPWLVMFSQACAKIAGGVVWSWAIFGERREAVIHEAPSGRPIYPQREGAA